MDLNPFGKRQKSEKSETSKKKLKQCPFDPLFRTKAYKVMMPVRLNKEFQQKQMFRQHPMRNAQITDRQQEHSLTPHLQATNLSMNTLD